MLEHKINASTVNIKKENLEEKVAKASGFLYNVKYKN